MCEAEVDCLIKYVHVSINERSVMLCHAPGGLGEGGGGVLFVWSGLWSIAPSRSRDHIDQVRPRIALPSDGHKSGDEKSLALPASVNAAPEPSARRGSPWSRSRRWAD